MVTNRNEFWDYHFLAGVGNSYGIMGFIWDFGIYLGFEKLCEILGKCVGDLVR